MTTLTTTTIEVWAIAHHCRIASERYTENAEMLISAGWNPDSELVKQFRKQASDAMAIANTLNDAVSINPIELNYDFNLEVTTEA